MAAATTLSGAEPALAAPAATGSPAGVALARAVAQAYQTVHLQAYTETGSVWMYAVLGKTSVFRFLYGKGPVRGYYPATEHAFLALDHGLVKWWADDLAPAPCPTPGLCARQPVRLVVDSSGSYYAYGDAARHTCFGRLTGTTPVQLGKGVWSVYGNFGAPVVLAGGRERLPSSYPYTVPGEPALTATESDVVSRATHRLLSTSVTVAPAAGHQVAPFSYSATYSYPGPMATPAVNLCAGA